MIEIENVKIGSDIYKIEYEAEVPNAEILACISQHKELIKMRKICPNNSCMSNRQIYKHLMHEIVHGLDYNTFFINEETEQGLEIAVELFSNYLIENICEFIDGVISFDDFLTFCELSEIKMIRHRMLFNMINLLFAENKALFNNFLEIFTEY